MGCTQSAETIRPNLFQTKLCMHHKTPVGDVYRCLGELGRGAFGVVEKVEHLQTQRHYAMKTVKFGSASQRHEFEKEMGILRVLHHPNIVRMLETFEDEHHFYIIMELSTGGTLLDHVKARNKELCEEEAKDIIRNLASVIQYLHSRNICHRDLKLENVLVENIDNCGHIKLCECAFFIFCSLWLWATHVAFLSFGASTMFKSGASMRKILGSVVYMAPEVLEGNYKESCDMWSLGVIMYMLLSNKAPFHGDTEDSLIESIFAGKVSFERKVWETVSPEAKSLLRKLLHTTPECRFTAAQVLQHSWIKSSEQKVVPEVYDIIIPRMKAFCNYSPFQRAALVAMAFCMSSQRVAMHAAVYNELNIAHNGTLKLQELRLTPALTRYQLDLDKIFTTLDQQNENGVNLLEFVAATIGPEDAADEELLLSTFHILDRSHRGAIAKDDLKALLGQHFDVAECREMIRKADADKDGKVNFEDFVKMMRLSTTLCGKCTQIYSNPVRIYDTGKCEDNPVSNDVFTKEKALQTTESTETVELDASVE